MSRSPSFEFAHLHRPGAWMTDAEIATLSREVRELGARCLDPLPGYQVFLATRAAFEDKVLVTARDPSSKRLLAFCSCVLLAVPAVGEVIHLGLTCVDPALRGSRLSNTLAARLLTRYVVTRRGLGPVWMTSVACVLQVLGNLAKNFHRVYPSPSQPRPFAPEVLRIAETFDRRYRHVAYVQPAATFDRASFVFRGSGLGTAFQKREDAVEFHHRDPRMNAYFAPRLDFDRGDEMLQVVNFRLWDLLRYEIGARFARLKAGRR